jgi:hypothetical protein
MKLDNPNFDTGVSVIIGFILIIGILSLGVTLYQEQAVPTQEQAKEIQHHRKTIDQFSDLRTSFVEAASGNEQTTSFKPGLTYGSPASIFVHSPPSTGNLQVKKYEDNVNIVNAEATDQSNTFWDADGDEEVVGDGANGFEYDTGYLVYEPQYYHFQNAPNQYLNYGLTYKEYRGGNRLVTSEQPVIDDNNINIIMMDGDINTGQVGSMSIQVKPISASTNSITIQEPQTGNRQIKVRLPTRMPATKWRELLQDQACEDETNPLSNGDTNCGASNGPGHIAEVEEESGTNRIIIYFEKDQTYDLKLSKLYLTTEESTRQTPSTKALYASWVGNEDITIRESSTVSIPGQALDPYNNPVTDYRVVAEAVDVRGAGRFPNDCYGGYESADENPNRVTCDNGQSSGTFYQRGFDDSENDGSVVFIYEAPEVGNDVRIEFRVCLARYLDEWGGSNDACTDVDENRGT